jgi:hypothetical protein
VAQQAFPLVVQGSEHLGRSRVEVLVSGLLLAHHVDLAEVIREVLGCHRLLGAPRHAGSKCVMSPVQRGETLEPGVTPGTKDFVDIPGSDEVPADMRKAVQRLDTLDAGKGLVDSVEVRAHHQGPARRERLGGEVDAEVGFEHRRRTGRVDVEAHGVRRDEDPQPPTVVRLSLQILEDLPARLVDMQMSRRGVAGADRFVERLEQQRDRFQRADEAALCDLEPFGS